MTQPPGAPPVVVVGGGHNAVQMLVPLSTDRLPPYPGPRAGDWNGLQSHVDTMEQLRCGFLSAEARRLPDPPPTYCFTPSAYDDSLARSVGTPSTWPARARRSTSRAAGSSRRTPSSSR